MILFTLGIACLPLSGIQTCFKMATIYWVPVAVIIIGFVILERSGNIKILSCSPLVSLGNASYEMYMTHLFVVTIFNHVGEIYLTSQSMLLQSIWMILCLLCSIFAGLAIQKYFNRPIINYIRNKWL